MIEKTDYFFVSIFTLETLLKLIGFGFKGFRRDNFNIFDAFVVLLSLIEFGMHLG